MAMLFGGSVQAEKTPALANIQLQTSGYGQPVAIVYGTARVAGVLIWYGDFTSTEVTTHQSAKGADVQSTEYTYTAAMQVGICEGPIGSFGIMWADKRVVQSPTFRSGEWTVTSTGPRTNPTPWTFLTSNHPTEAVSYAGTAYVAGPLVSLPSAAPRNYSFEVVGFCATVADGPYFSEASDPLGLFSTTGYDAHPADILIDLFSNVDYGLGWDPSIIVTDIGADGTANSSFRYYCHALGFYLSFAMTEQRQGLEWFQDILDCSNSAAVWSQGKLKIIPYGDTSATGNGHTYTPDTAPIYDLDGDDFLPMSAGDPIRIERTNLQDCFNAVPLEYLDRHKSYREVIAEDADQAEVEASGLRRAEPINAHMICRPDVALALSRIHVQRNLWIRNTYSFTLPQRYVLLEPMDLVTLTEPALGLDAHVVRIRSIRETDEGAFEVTAEEWPFGVGTHTLYAGQTGDGVAVNYDAAPGDANSPLLFVPTLQLTGGTLQLWLLTNGGANWGGADVYISDDNTTFNFAGSTIGARYGVLTTSPSSGSTSIGVDLSASSGTLDGTTPDGAAADLTMMWVDSEAFSYETATLTGTHQYTLGGCLRGRESTPPTAHTAGATVLRLDDNVFKHDLAYATLGTTIYVKLVSFNKLGGAKQDLASVSSYSFAIPASPDILPRPDAVTVAIAGTPFP